MLVSESSRRKALLRELGMMGGRFSRGQIKDQKTEITFLPEYKFYTEMVLTLYRYSRKYGVAVSKLLPSLREGLMKDDQFERSVEKVIAEMRGQMLLISVVTWIFFLAAHSVLSIPLQGIGDLLAIASGQLAGAISHDLFMRYLKRKFFSLYPPFLKAIYFFPALMEVGVPFSQALRESSLPSLKSTPGRRSPAQIHARLLEVLDSFQQRGSPFLADFQEMKGELWFLLEEAYGDFLKWGKGAGFLVLLVFFLGSYFYSLYALMDSGMAFKGFPSTF